MTRKLMLLVAGCAALYVGGFVAVFDVELRRGAIGNDGFATTFPRSVVGPLYRSDCDDWFSRYCSTSTLHKIFCPLNAIWTKCYFDSNSGDIVDVTKYN